MEKNVRRCEKQVQRIRCGKECGIQHVGAGRDEIGKQSEDSSHGPSQVMSRIV